MTLHLTPKQLREAKRKLKEIDCSKCANFERVVREIMK
jgi:hypothetical protein